MRSGPTSWTMRADPTVPRIPGPSAVASGSGQFRASQMIALGAAGLIGRVRMTMWRPSGCDLAMGLARSVPLEGVEGPPRAGGPPPPTTTWIPRSLGGDPDAP